MLTPPIFQEVEEANNILIAGAGGGYDIFCGLPLYFGLAAQGKTVYLANLSFSFLPPSSDRLASTMLAVMADTIDHTGYFPEKYLADWFQTQGESVIIYAFERTGVKPLLANYETLVQHLNLDTIVLVDGGTDSLMRGDEDGLGTPQEDMTSITAVSQLNIPRKILACLGFGVDRFHGVSNDLTLSAIADLSQNGGYLGAFSLVAAQPEAKRYREACAYVFEQMPDNVSIVSSSILSSLSGLYGDHHATPRTRNSRLWINPLMSVYWCFQVTAVADRLLYLNLLKETETYRDIRQAIMHFRNQLETIQTRHPIPD
ncbi:MAG: DUF1152 domain-containing protein [Chloroflexi bacterium]|nr:DUF1152 domain-containing protein [Chloroflexota bacterium]